MLADKSCKLIERLENLSSASSNADESESLSKLFKHLEPKAQQIDTIKNIFQVYRSSSIKTKFQTEMMQSLLDELSTLKEKFNHSPISETLKKEKRWDKLIDKIDEFIKLANQQQLSDWEIFHDNLYGGLSPVKIAGQLALTPSNKKALEDFKKIYGEFLRYRRRLPENGRDVNSVRSLASNMAAIKFDFSVPDDVKFFFEATATSDGASLALLTNGVIDWLKANNLLNTYFVRAKGT